MSLQFESPVQCHNGMYVVIITWDKIANYFHPSTNLKRTKENAQSLVFTCLTLFCSNAVDRAAVGTLMSAANCSEMIEMNCLLSLTDRMSCKNTDMTLSRHLTQIENNLHS